MAMRFSVLLCIASLQLAAGILHHPGHMQPADRVLQRCLAESGITFSQVQSHSQRIDLDARALNDVHFEPLTDAPLDSGTISAVEGVCAQRSGSAVITSTRSFYVACSSTAAALASSDLALVAQSSVAHHRMTGFEAAAVCDAAAQPAGSPLQLVATVAANHGLQHVSAAFTLALAKAHLLQSVFVHEESRTVLSFHCPAALAPLLSHWLIHRAVVQHVHRRPDFRLLNANAAGTVQSGVPKQNSLWALGLRGQGQVVHVGDTGVDWNLCFFQTPAAPSTPPNFFQQKLSKSSPLQCSDDRGPLQPSSSHKFAAYITINGGDDRDENGGHGTHVCGSVAGGAPNTTELSKHNGMAPEAQLAFTDLQGAGGGLSVPNDLCNSYFPCAWQSGARISSNSWGGGNMGYDAFSSSLDQFTVDHDDMLIVFAAGNDGPGAYTVITPALAKNVLAIGATVNTHTNSDVGLGSGVKFLARHGASFTAASTLAQFAENPVCSGISTYSIGVPDNQLACDELCRSGESPFANRLVLLKRGTCTFQSKAARAIACGAAAVVIINYEDQLLSMAGDGVSPSVGNVSVYLIKSSDGASAMKCESATYPFPVSKPDGSPLAFFSSMGPTYDGRIKPDIVAPGMVVLSAKAMNADNCTRDPTHQTPCSSCSGNGFCHADPSVTTMMGTSMSTPIVSGAAALVRQYFQDGLFPKDAIPGEDPAGFLPSSALMRAMLLASAHSVSEMIAARDADPFSLNSIPSMAQGHGIIQLDTVLTFNTSQLFVVDRKPISKDDPIHYYAFNAAATMAPQVTLSWTDPVMRPNNLFLSVLVNDLDLELHSPSGKVTSGNFAQNVVNGLPYASRDTDNNNERIVVHPKFAESGVWTAVVRASRMMRPPQLYALVFSSNVPFIKADTPPPLTCPSGCSNKGSCVNGTCTCNDDRAGIACDMEVLTAPLGQYLAVPSLKLNPQSWSFIRVPVAVGTIVTIQQTSSSMRAGDADMYMVARKKNAPLLLPTTTATINQTFPANQKCDLCCDTDSGQMQPCPPGQCTHNITFHVTDPSVSEYVLGVTAFCCDAALLSLAIDTRFSAQNPPPPLCAARASNNAADADDAGVSRTKLVIVVSGESIAAYPAPSIA